MSSGDGDSSAIFETQDIAISEFDICCLLVIGFLLLGVFSIFGAAAATDAFGVAAIVLALLFIGFQLNKIAKTKPKAAVQ